MPCALLGDRASGKTTFLGLLYAAQVRYGTGVQEDFRFHAPMASLGMMSAVYEGMKDGRFPSATLQEDDDRNRHAGLQENASVRQHGREVDRCLPDLQEARVRPAEGFRDPSGATEDLPRLCHVEVRYPSR